MTHQLTRSILEAKTYQGFGIVFVLQLLLLAAFAYVELSSFGYAALVFFGVSFLLAFKWTRIAIVVLFTAFWTVAVYQAFDLMGKSLWVSIPLSALAFFFIYYINMVAVNGLALATPDLQHDI